MAANDRLTQPRVLPEVGVAPDDRVADFRVLVDHREVPHAGGPVDEDPGLELAFVADVGGAVDLHVVADLDVLADKDVALAPLSGDLDVHPAFERIPVRLVIGLNVADVAPVAARQVAVQRHRIGEHLGKHVAAPIDHAGRRQQVEHLRLDQVDAGVDLVREHLAPGWLFQEAIDGPVRIRDHHAELERVRHRGEHDRGRRLLLPVILHHLAEIDVGHRIAADDDEGLVQVLLRVLDTAGGAQRRVLDDIGDVDAEVRAVPKIVADRGTQVLQRHHHIRDAVVTQQPQDMFHDRLADHRHQRLRDAAGQRPQPRPLATRHHYRLHAGSATFWMRSRKKAAESSGLTTLIHIPVPSSKPAAVLSFGISSRCQ